MTPRGRQHLELLERVEAALAAIPVLAFEVPADITYGAIRADLERIGQIIGHNDLLIAAHACFFGPTLATAKAREFNRMASLKIENWLE